jgi:hypothetical protein
MRFHANRIDHGVRASTVGPAADDVRQVVVMLGQIENLDTSAPCPFQALGHEVDGDHAVAAQLGDSRRHVADRAKTENDDRAAVRNGRILNRLPGGRQHVGQIDKAVVGRAFRNLDWQGVPERHTQILGLSARHLAVELRVAEQSSTHALLTYLCRLTLRVQALRAHKTGATRDVERHHDPVTIAQRGHLGPRRFDDAYRLMPKHVALTHERPKHFVQMQVRSANTTRRHPHDHVSRFFDPRVGHRLDPHVAPAMPRQCLHHRLRIEVSRFAYLQR